MQNRESTRTIRPKHSVLAALSSLATNALLRCEQCNTDATAYHLNHLNQRIVKMPSVANHS
ncbi:hypothetical protein EOJ41_18380 [Vibrio alginolyticus]|nr:hypothetical protein EOJ41_18380 [Vibrio alginolyticus]